MKNTTKIKVKPLPAQADLYITTTPSNVIVGVGVAGAILAKSSNGMHGFKHTRKSSIFATSTSISSFLKTSKDRGLASVTCILKGFGSGREAALKALLASGLKITCFIERTPLRHGGCRPPRERKA